jgi:GNAT superfamily N-acetyltransferase
LHPLEADLGIDPPQAVTQPQPDPARAGRLTWIPVRALSSRHRGRIVSHLLELPQHDRYLRFGLVASDAQISAYVEALNFERDELLGIFNRRLDLVAMAHLAYTVESDGSSAREAELGLSVAAQARRRGYGSRLFEHAVLRARNHGFQTFLIHALSENAAMLRIARQAGAEVVRDGVQSQARLRLAPESFGSHVAQWMEDGASALDYRLKRHTLRRPRWADSLAAKSASEQACAVQRDSPG